MESPARPKIKIRNTVGVSVYLTEDAIRSIDIAAKRRFVKRAQMIRMIVMKSLQEHPEEYANTEDNVSGTDTETIVKE